MPASISVAPFFRVTDPRLPYLPPDVSTLQGQDAVPGGFFQQTKYNGYDAGARLASKLEADYIAAEATGGNAGQLALINARRSANGQPAYAGPTDDASVLTEFFTQRAFDFFLEGKRIADYRRKPAAVPGITPAGGAYFKPGYPAVGTQTCYPLPRAERDNNPNMQ